ncbi:MAG: tRNA 4-thiouridine(8) synthase ThiI [Planctomycetes bacterium]|jgi:thiamine biosynthesis protein ThiI|nr:tRNA 4-thiouridine(8) synthase ThiI [Planctomycetota bacterium]
MSTTETREVLLARYGELWLKGKNRGNFERRLARNVRRALKTVAPGCTVEREHGMLVVRPAQRAREATQRLQEVFGLSSISPARKTMREFEAIAETSLEAMRAALARYPDDAPIPFRVETRRSDKRFHLTSVQLDRQIGECVMAEFGPRLSVNLSKPELVLGINVRAEQVYVFAERIPGAGGLPVGSVGRVVSLFSGGIDSPVASWMAMKRGLEVIFSSFHSYPYVGASFLRKAEKLVRRLTRFQNSALFCATPLTRIQEAIRDGAPKGYRTVLYRRAMQRIATRIAEDEGAGGLVTGECVGQVASQTLENMRCIQDVSDLPVLRPLVAFDKSETIALAKKIGTFELSIEPEPDCCTVFQPQHPILRARIDLCDEVESRLSMEELLAEAYERTERIPIAGLG